MPEHVQKLGSKLRRADPEAYRRRRLILGYHELPENRGKLEREAPIEQVTINNLQTLRCASLHRTKQEKPLGWISPPTPSPSSPPRPLSTATTAPAPRRYLDLDLGYKQELLSYRLKTLNEELHGVLADPELALPKAGERKERGRAVLAGFVPAITPGGSGGSR